MSVFHSANSKSSADVADEIQNLRQQTAAGRKLFCHGLQYTFLQSFLEEKSQFIEYRALNNLQRSLKNLDN